MNRRSFIGTGASALALPCLTGCAPLTAPQLAVLNANLSATVTLAGDAIVLLPLLGVNPAIIAAATAMEGAAQTALKSWQDAKGLPDALTIVQDAAAIYADLPSATQDTVTQVMTLLRAAQASTTIATIAPLAAKLAALAPVVASQLTAARMAQATERMRSR